MCFNYKVTARNLFRYKTRMLMTILGVAGCTALLVMGFVIRHYDPMRLIVNKLVLTRYFRSKFRKTHQDMNMLQWKKVRAGLNKFYQGQISPLEDRGN